MKSLHFDTHALCGKCGRIYYVTCGKCGLRSLKSPAPTYVCVCAPERIPYMILKKLKKLGKIENFEDFDDFEDF